jgi:predicted nucleic acid-binding protein
MSCTIVKAFVDTNVLVYAYDRGAGPKHEQALSLVEELWKEGNGVLSTQVLQEFYVNVRRKAKKPVSIGQARALITDYLSWDPILNDGATMLEAIDMEQRYQLSFWDALIVVAAQKGGASVLFSEDFNHGQKFGSVVVQNPFIS